MKSLAFDLGSKARQARQARLLPSCSSPPLSLSLPPCPRPALTLCLVLVGPLDLWSLYPPRGSGGGGEEEEDEDVDSEV